MATLAIAAQRVGVPSDADILAAGRQLGAGIGSLQPQLWRTLTDAGVDLRDLCRAVESDPALAARVLRVANSAYYRRAGGVGSIGQAIQLLGIDAVRGIAAAAGLDRMAASSARAAVFIRHSLATASLTRDIARQLEVADAELAFLAGLLHDIGVLVEWRLGAAAGGDRHGHDYCGEVLLQHWQLPAALCRAAAGHHGRALAPAAVGLADCVRLAHLALEDTDYRLGDEPTDDAAMLLEAAGLLPTRWQALCAEGLEGADQLIASLAS